MDPEPIQLADGPIDVQAEQLYLHYGAVPWERLPEVTREHFRGLVRVGIDGSGQALAP